MKNTLTGLALLSLASIAHAAPITIENFSFVDPAIAVNPDAERFIDRAPPAWSIVRDGGNAVGVANPINSLYGGTGGGGVDGNLPGTGEGVTYGYLNIGNGGTASMTYGGTSLGTFSDFGTGAAFTLTVAIGERLNLGAPTYTLELLNDGAAVAFSQGTATAGNFTDLVTNFVTTTETGLIGIRITGTNTSGGFRQANFDNVRLDIAAVPEPSTLGLLGLTTVGIAAVRRRRS